MEISLNTPAFLLVYLSVFLCFSNCELFHLLSKFNLSPGLLADPLISKFHNFFLTSKFRRYTYTKSSWVSCYQLPLCQETLRLRERPSCLDSGASILFYLNIYSEYLSLTSTVLILIHQFVILILEHPV